MNNIILSFLISFFAGISTLIGVIPIFINNKDDDTIICISLAFAAGVMMSISIFDLLPESFSFIENLYWVFRIFIIFIGLLMGYIICFFIDQNILNNNSLYKVGIMSMIGIIIHNIPEGIITFITVNKDLRLGISLAIAIAFHNIPEGISISLPIYYSTNSKYKAFIYTFVAGVSELFGAFITYLFLINYINNFILGFLLSLTAGIMIYISLFELLSNSILYNKTKLTCLFFAFGFFLVIFSLLL